MPQSPYILRLSWILGNAVLVLVICERLITIYFGHLDPDSLFQNDFVNLWSGGRLASIGDFATLYDKKAFGIWQEQALYLDAGRQFSYPPTIFPIAQLASILSYQWALLCWVIATASLFLFAARDWRTVLKGPLWLAILTPAAIQNIYLGQSAFLFGAIWLCIFANLDKRPLLAGALIGLLTMKPQIAVLLPLILVLSGRRRVFVAAGFSSLAWVGVSIVLYGIDPWHQFFGATFERQLGFVEGSGFFVNLSTSTVTAVHAWTGNWVIAWSMHCVMASAAILVVVKSIQAKCSPLQLALIVSTATFVVLPYALSYDLVVPMLAAWTIMASLTASRGTKLLAAIGFVAPQIGLAFSAFAFPVIPFMLAALLAAQWRTLKEDQQTAKEFAGH